MNLQAIFPTGVTEITVHGLHQWDYGRKLDVKSTALADVAVAEVHFVCTGIDRAIVRTCDVSLARLTAAIPDVCLQQSTPVLAWVFIPGATEGFTVLKITMPVEARPEPAELSTEPPEDYSNQYTDVIEAARSVIANTYPRAEIEAALGLYITDIDALIGGGD